MNEASALQVFDLAEVPPLDVLEEIIEDAVFEVREYFLRNPVIPELYESRIRRLRLIDEASKSLGLKAPQVDLDFQKFEFEQLSDLIEVIRLHEEQLTSLRFGLSASLDPNVVSSHASEMIAAQISYEEHFFTLTEVFGISEDSVKASEHVDTGKLLFMLRSASRPDVAPIIKRERKRIKDAHERRHRQRK